jgi:hypothetical protein
MGVTTTATVILGEEGAGIIQVEFKDEDGVAVVPNTATVKWTLTNKPLPGVLATIINSREQIAITEASTINIVLEGDDLALIAGETSELFAERTILVEYQYDSSVQVDIDDKAQHFFKIENHKYTT